MSLVRLPPSQLRDLSLGEDARFSPLPCPLQPQAAEPPRVRQSGGGTGLSTVALGPYRRDVQVYPKRLAAWSPIRRRPSRGFSSPGGTRQIQDESLPYDRRVVEAKAEAKRLFPPGSKADDFETYLRNSGAKCTRGADTHGPFVTCIYSIYGLLIETDWTISAGLESAGYKTTNVLVTRYLTGF